MSMVCQALLTAASLCVQARFDVIRGDHGRHAISLFFCSVVESGGRKNTVDDVAFGPLREWEEGQLALHKEEVRTFDKDHAIWTRWKTRLLGNNKLSDAEVYAALDTNAEPTPPPQRAVIHIKGTTEGLVKYLHESYGNIALIPQDAAVFLGGYSMSKEKRLQTGGVFCEIHGGQGIRDITASMGLRIVHGRMAVHFAIQPRASRNFLTDPDLKDQGWLARFFLSEPQSTVGQRPFKEYEPEDLAVIARYRAQVLDHLAAKVRYKVVNGKTTNVIDPGLIKTSAEAMSLWIQCRDRSDLFYD